LARKSAKNGRERIKSVKNEALKQKILLNVSLIKNLVIPLPAKEKNVESQSNE